jgi:hypothetical protein
LYFLSPFHQLLEGGDLQVNGVTPLGTLCCSLFVFYSIRCHCGSFSPSPTNISIGHISIGQPTTTWQTSRGAVLLNRHYSYTRKIDLDQSSCFSGNARSGRCAQSNKIDRYRLCRRMDAIVISHSFFNSTIVTYVPRYALPASFPLFSGQYLRWIAVLIRALMYGAMFPSPLS